MKIKMEQKTIKKRIKVRIFFNYRNFKKNYPFGILSNNNINYENN